MFNEMPSSFGSGMDPSAGLAAFFERIGSDRHTWRAIPLFATLRVGGGEVVAVEPEDGVAVIAFEHHEYWNGSGYPHGKAGESIS